MSDIKSTIALICKLLKVLYGCNMKNEHFRLAKFNSTKDDTVSHFWQLLFNMCKDEYKSKVFSGENIVNFVKLNLAALKYNSLQFYSLPVDMSSGSRELLLAFAWLVASQDVLEKATRRKVMESSISKEFSSTNFSQINENSHDMKINLKSLQSASNTLLWYAGKICHNLKAIEELGQEWMYITTKIHDETQNVCGLPHLSTGDAKLVYDTIDSPTGYEDLVNSTVLIEANSNWLKKSSTFWEWMETVIAERDKEPSQRFGIEVGQILLSFIKILKRIVEGVIHERKSKLSCDANSCSSEETCTGNAETFCEVPRYILQKGNSETVMKTLLSDLSEQKELLEKEYNMNLKDVKCFLDNFSKKMTGVTVLNL